MAGTPTSSIRPGGMCGASGAPIRTWRLAGTPPRDLRCPRGSAARRTEGGSACSVSGRCSNPTPPAQPAGSPGSPLGVPSLAASSVPSGGGGFIGTALNGIPVVWANWNSSQGNACSHWGFRLVTDTEIYQWEPPGLEPTTVWTYQPPLPLVAQSQNWISGSGMFAQYPASTSGCPSPAEGPGGH